MILKRIHIEGYKTLRNPVELKDLGVGIHLIHGPNETGKSTLMAAIARAFFDRYNTTDQEIRALRPWGTELAPRVIVEFETGGRRFKLEKKFLDEESSSLSEWSGNRFERVADSVKADDQVRATLLGTAAKTGAAGLGNWGLARLLWMTQLPSRMSAPALDETLRQHLLGVLGSAVLSETEQRLLARLDKAYDVYFTAAKQSEKKGSPLHDARERLLRAEKDLEHWKSKWDEVSKLNETSVDAETRLKTLEKERTTLEGRIRELRTRAQAELELEGRIKLKDQELLVAQGRWKTLSALQGEIQGIQQQQELQEKKARALEPQLGEDEGKLRKLEAALSESTAQSQVLQDETAAVSREMGQAAMLADVKALLQQKQSLAALIESARGIEKERQSKREAYAARKRPKETDLVEVRTLDQEAQLLRKRIEDLGIEVRVMPERGGLRVQWVTPESAGTESDAADTLIFRSSDSGELVIPGVGRIRIRSGAEDSRKLKERANEVQAKLTARLGIFGVTSLEELQALRSATAELETEGQALLSSLQSTLGPRYKTLDEAHAELGRVEQALGKQLEQAGLSEAELASRVAPDVRALNTKLSASKQALEEAQRARAAAEAEIRALRTRMEQARTGLDSARQSVALLGSQLQAKLASAGGREQLDREAGEAVLAKNALESEREALMRLLPPADQRASARISALERELTGASQRELAAREEFSQASALLHAAQGEGYYSKLAAAEEERALAQEILAQRLAYAQGTKVLRALAHAKRERMNSNLLAPIEGAVTRIFDEIRGAATHASGRLKFGSDLNELGIQEGGLDLLSLGTQEQAMLALRLAFGELLSERGERPEPQLIVLDDPLVNADLARQERALELLRKAGTRLQILILTARPDDYRALSPKEYDLGAIKAGTA